MDTQSIVDLKYELVSRDQPRHDKYDLNMAAIGGSYDNRRMEGFWDVWEGLTGKVRPKADDREEYEFQINLIPNIIKSARSFISVIPSIQCPTSTPVTPSDSSPKNRSEKLERVLAGHWEFSHIGKRMNQVGYWLPSLGTAVGVVWPNVAEKRPAFQVRSPYGCYPVFADVDGFEMKQVIFRTHYQPRQAAAMYPQFHTELVGLEGPVEVVEYHDGERIVTIIDDQYRVKDIENKWGFVSCFLIPNESFGEGPWGDDAISQVIPVQEEYRYRESLKTAILEQTILQPLAIEGGENLPEEIPMGPRDAIPVQMGGRVYRVQPVQVPYQYLQSQSELIKLIDRVSNVPDVLRSQWDGNVLTGKGVSTLLGPTQMQWNVVGNEMYPALARGNEMAMKMWHALWPRRTHNVWSLDSRKGMQVETFKTGEFGGFYKNVVSVDAASYFDSNSLFITVLQAVQNRMMSRQTGMQFVPGVDDPIREQALIDAEFEKDMQLQQAAAAFDQANVQPDMGAQGALNAQLGQGYAGETGAPEPIGGMEPGGAPGGEEVPQESGFLDDMAEFFQGIPLKGRVWLAGKILQPGYSPQSPDYAGVDVFLEEPGDKSAINTTMRTKFPEVWGHLTYHEGEPNEPAVLVYDPNEVAPPLEAETPEPTGVEALMGGM